MGDRNVSAMVYCFGTFEAAPANNSLTRRGVRIKIQDQPFRLLLALLERRGEIVTREELRQKLWPEGTYVDFDGSLNVILKRLRAALHDDSANPTFVETVPRQGYRFIAPVTVVGTPPASVEQEGPVIDPAVARESEPEPLPAVGARRLRWIYAASVLGLLAVFVGARAWHRRSVRQQEVVAASTPPLHVRRSAAVVDFRNLSGVARMPGWRLQLPR